MEVVIDGQLYIPAPPPAVDKQWLDVRFYDDTSLNREVSIREFFHDMMQHLWSEMDGFSGKRPFGNGGWEYPVIRALVAAGAISGEVIYDEDGYIEDETYDYDEGHKFVVGLLSQLFFGDK